MQTYRYVKPHPFPVWFIHWSGILGPLARQTFKVLSARFASTGLVLTPTTSTACSGGVDVTFGNLIPPLLLRRRPDFFLSAVFAPKRRGYVVTTIDELRGPVAIVRAERAFVHNHDSSPQLSPVRCLFALRTSCRALSAPSLDLCSAFPSARHFVDPYHPQPQPQLHSPPPCAVISARARTMSLLSTADISQILAFKYTPSRPSKRSQIGGSKCSKNLWSVSLSR
jgi:hypothetical protein